MKRPQDDPAGSFSSGVDFIVIPGLTRNPGFSFLDPVSERDDGTLKLAMLAKRFSSFSSGVHRLNLCPRKHAVVNADVVQRSVIHRIV